MVAAAMGALVLPGTLFANVPVGESPLGYLVGNYCVSCHNPEERKGKLDLEGILEADLSQHFEIWEEVAWMLREREMPPEEGSGVSGADDNSGDKDVPAPLPRPSEDEYVVAVNWLDGALGGEGAKDGEELGISAVVEQYCISCHNDQENKGAMDLDAVLWDDVQNHPEIWEKVIVRLQSRQMPPYDRKRPDQETYEAAVADLASTTSPWAPYRPVCWIAIFPPLRR